MDTKNAAAGEKAGATADERRRSPREPYTATAWLSAEAGNSKSHQQRVSVFDLSLHGVGFRSARPMERDSVRWMVMGAGSLQVSSRLRVVASRPGVDGGYDVGAEFF